MGKLAEKKEMAPRSKSYLILYNGVQTIGWSYMLFKLIKFLLEKKTTVGLWDETRLSLVVFQTLACLEVIHCMLRLVPSSALVTFVQIFARVFMIWGILMRVEKSQNAPSLALTLIAWGITEVTRYSYYCLNLMGSQPRFLTWCRYSFFYVSFPAGILGELGNIFGAIETIRIKRLFTISQPNAFNMSFNSHYTGFLIMAIYASVFPQLFNHMRRQRKKILFGSEPKAEKKVH